MAERANFTADRIKRFECDHGKRQQIYWDGKTAGFGVRVTAGGSKSFIFETRVHGRTMRTTIGGVKAWPIEKARKEANRLRRLTDKDIDPREVEREGRAKAASARLQAEAARLEAEAEARRGSLLVADAWAAYLTYQRERMGRLHVDDRWGARHMADHVNLSQAGGKKKKRGEGVTVPGVLHPLMQMRMVDVNADALAKWQIREAQTRPNNARQGFELFRAFWRWCASRPDYRSIIDAQSVESEGVRDEVPSRKSKRFDTLELGQLPAWFAAVRGLDNPVISAYLQGLLLTGARREEMAALRWKDVDFKWGSLWVKDKVAAEGRKIPLTPYLQSLLLDLKRINETPPPAKLKKRAATEPAAPWKPSEWVFFSKAAADGRIAEPRIAHNRVLSVAGLNHVTLHGLRRTFANMAEWVEMPRGVVAQIMGHAPNATAERHYINRPLDLLAVWHGKYEAWILEQAGVQFDRVQGQHGLHMVNAAQS